MQPEVKVEQVQLDTLKPYSGNAKKHTNEQIDAVEQSIKQFGFRNPILAWHNEAGEAEIVAGHGRAIAAKKLGIKEVPVVFVDDLTDAQRRMLTHADNQTTMMTGWDLDQLAYELDVLSADFDVSDFGFELDEGESELNEEKYSQKLGKVDYEPSDTIREPSELYEQTDRFDSVIEALEAPEEIKELCRIRAHWFCEFNFGKIADYYCNQATPEEQRVFEALALVLLDRDQMIENGFVKMVGDIEGLEDGED